MNTFHLIRFVWQSVISKISFNKECCAWCNWLNVYTMNWFFKSFWYHWHCYIKWNKGINLHGLRCYLTQLSQYLEYECAIGQYLDQVPLFHGGSNDINHVSTYINSEISLLPVNKFSLNFNEIKPMVFHNYQKVTNEIEFPLLVINNIVFDKRKVFTCGSHSKKI